MNALHAVFWTEFERGWGSRPDGYSFHKSKDELEAFVKRVESNDSGNEYCRAGTPEILEVSEELHKTVMATGDLWTGMNNKRAALIWAKKPN